MRLTASFITHPFLPIRKFKNMKKMNLLMTTCKTDTMKIIKVSSTEELKFINHFKDFTTKFKLYVVLMRTLQFLIIFLASDFTLVYRYMLCSVNYIIN